MMSPEDALGLMEDMAILNQANAGVEDAMRRAQRNAHSRGALQASQTATMAVVIKTQQEQLAQARAELAKISNARNAHAAISAATNTVLHGLIKAQAELTGEGEASIRSRLNYERSRAYDKQIAQYLKDGYLLVDPRTDPEMCLQTPWYIPEYD